MSIKNYSAERCFLFTQLSATTGGIALGKMRMLTLKGSH